MAQHIQAIRGMNDTLPLETGNWLFIESLLRQIAISYGYQEIRFPIIEKTDLFKRSIGEVTDIVEKEMYTFEDRNGDSLTLRPEGTASCVRAAIEHGLLYNQIQRLWYLGPMFRYERPQKGRYRQFHHFGVEAFGMSGPEIEAELILLSARFWRKLGVEQHLSLQINSLGTSDSRAIYRNKLVAYFTEHFAELDEDSKRRLETNPLRILDSKNPHLQSLIEKAPSLLEYLDEESLKNFAQLQKLLTDAKISFVVNPRLVRGLDYYNQTVFEWVTTDPGAQNTVCAGGRYDGLVGQLGGHPTPAAGFAVGVERLLALYVPSQPAYPIDAYFIRVGEPAREKGLILAEKLRDSLPELQLVVDAAGGGFKHQFKRADKIGANLALILGEEELKKDTIAVKYLRTEQQQENIAQDGLVEYLRTRLK